MIHRHSGSIAKIYYQNFIFGIRLNYNYFKILCFCKYLILNHAYSDILV